MVAGQGGLQVPWDVGSGEEGEPPSGGGPGPLVTNAPPQWNVSSLAFVALPGLQILLLDAGCLLSLWILWSKAKDLAPHRALRLFLPWLLLVAALYAIGIWIIFQPMEMRGTLIR